MDLWYFKKWEDKKSLFLENPSYDYLYPAGKYKLSTYRTVVVMNVFIAWCKPNITIGVIIDCTCYSCKAVSV